MSGYSGERYHAWARSIVGNSNIVNGVWEEVAFKHLRNRPALDDEPPAVLRDGCIDLLGLRENFL